MIDQEIEEHAWLLEKAVRDAGGALKPEAYIRLGNMTAAGIAKILRSFLVDQQWMSMETCPLHQEVLFYRKDAGVFSGSYTSCDTWMSDAEQEAYKGPESDIHDPDYWGFGPDGIFRCDGDLKPERWMHLPDEPTSPK